MDDASFIEADNKIDDSNTPIADVVCADDAVITTFGGLVGIPSIVTSEKMMENDDEINHVLPSSRLNNTERMIHESRVNEAEPNELLLLNQLDSEEQVFENHHSHQTLDSITQPPPSYLHNHHLQKQMIAGPSSSTRVTSSSSGIHISIPIQIPGSHQPASSSAMLSPSTPQNAYHTSIESEISIELLMEKIRLKARNGDGTLDLDFIRHVESLFN